MLCFNKRLLLLAFLGLNGLFALRSALADGGAVRATETSGGLAISVFTAPAILTAGEVDISVLVQDAESQGQVANTQVHVTVTPREHSYLAERHEATSELATNRLMKSCHVLLQQGWHDVEVLVNGNGRRGRATFAMLVGSPPSRAASFWPWFTWPAIPIAMVAANLAYRHLQTRRSAIIQRRHADSASPNS